MSIMMILIILGLFVLFLSILIKYITHGMPGSSYTFERKDILNSNPPKRINVGKLIILLIILSLAMPAMAVPVLNDNAYNKAQEKYFESTVDDNVNYKMLALRLQGEAKARKQRHQLYAGYTVAGILLLHGASTYWKADNGSAESFIGLATFAIGEVMILKIKMEW